MTRRGSCVKLNDDYTLVRRTVAVCPLPSSLAFSFIPFSPFVHCTFPHQRLNRAVPVHEPRGEDVLRNRWLLSNIFLPVCATHSADTCPGKIPEATAYLPTVITCRLAGQSKNPPIAINHGELEKTARGNAYHVHIYSSFPFLSPLSLSLSLFLSRGFFQSCVHARNFSRHSAASRIRRRFWLSESVVTGSATGNFPLIAVKRDTLRPGQNIGISFETRYSRAIIVCTETPIGNIGRGAKHNCVCARSVLGRK